VELVEIFVRVEVFSERHVKKLSADSFSA
jgi:hypothetical protein